MPCIKSRFFSKGKKDKDGDKKKDNGKTDPNLVVPEGPAKTAEPGPAYSPQPLTLRGYTQYFANLTYLNNDMTLGFDGSDNGNGNDGNNDDDDDNIESNKWREGDHSDKEPKKNKPKPHPFAYQVEYSTFTDKIYNLSDMTVNSLLEMAYRMGKKTSGKSVVDIGDGEVVEDGDADVEDVEDVDGFEGDEDDADFEDAAGKKKKKDKKKKEQNELWLHFLRHAFVSSVDSDKLKKMT